MSCLDLSKPSDITISDKVIEDYKNRLENEKQLKNKLIMCDNTVVDSSILAFMLLKTKERGVYE